MSTKIKKTVWILRRKIAAINADPKKIALGYALGIFLAASPLIGIKVFIAIPITLLLKWNKVAALIGIFHINPLTGPVFYGFSFMIGKLILGGRADIGFSWKLSYTSIAALFTTQLALFKCLLLGGVIIGLPASLFAYYAIKKFLSHKSNLNPQNL